MIEVINRELLIPREEYNIGTCYDDNTETRHFHLKRVTSSGIDLAALTFNLDVQYADGNTDAASLVKEVTDKDINLVLTINNSMLQVPGTVLVQIRALDEDGVCKWTSYKSAFFVEDHINTPGHYEGDLTQLEQYEAEWGKVRDNINQLNSRMDEVVKIHDETPATEVEEEVIDGRVGYNGTQYDSFGTAVRQQIIDVREDMEDDAANWTEALAAEVTARQAADATLQGNINAEASTRASQDASLQSQINQIIAPSGEAPSAAEVQNARIGADNVTYPTLGEAIRGQVRNLKNALRNTDSNIDVDGTYTTNDIVSGYIWVSSGGGQKAANANYKCSNALIPMHGSKLLVTDKHEYAYVYCFDKDKTPLGQVQVWKQNTGREYKVTPASTEYISITVPATDTESVLSVRELKATRTISAPFSGKDYSIVDGKMKNSGTTNAFSDNTNYMAIIFLVDGISKLMISGAAIGPTIYTAFKFYNESNEQVVVDSTHNPTYAEERDTAGYVWTVPDGAKFCWANIDKRNLHDSVISSYVSAIDKEKVLCIGDSLTWLNGQSGYDNATRFYGWQNALFLDGYDTYSIGKSGYTIAKTNDHGSLYSTIVENDTDVTSYNYIIIFAGTNDVIYDVPLGDRIDNYETSTFDPTTFNGALSGLISYIRANNDSCKIVLCTSTKSQNPDRTFDDVASYISDLKYNALFWGCQIVDIFSTMNVSPETSGFTEYFYDNTHPNRAGMMRIGELILDGIKHPQAPAIDVQSKEKNADSLIVEFESGGFRTSGNKGDNDKRIRNKNLIPADCIESITLPTGYQISSYYKYDAKKSLIGSAVSPTISITKFSFSDLPDGVSYVNIAIKKTDAPNNDISGYVDYVNANTVVKKIDAYDDGDLLHLFATYSNQKFTPDGASTPEVNLVWDGYRNLNISGEFVSGFTRVSKSVYANASAFPEGIIPGEHYWVSLKAVDNLENQRVLLRPNASINVYFYFTGNGQIGPITYRESGELYVPENANGMSVYIVGTRGVVSEENDAQGEVIYTYDYNIDITLSELAIYKNAPANQLMPMITKNNLPLYVSFIDDDAQSDMYCGRYFQNCMHNGVLGSYAVQAYKLSNGDLTVNTMLEYEEKGFGMLTHCWKQTNRYRANTDRMLELCREDMIRALRDMRNAGFITYNHFVIPYGTRSDKLRDIARYCGFESAISTVDRDYNKITDDNKYYIKRISFEPSPNYEEDETSSYNTALNDIKNMVKNGSGWAVITTHFCNTFREEGKRWDDFTFDTTEDENGYQIGYTEFNDFCDAIKALGCTIVPFTVGFNYFTKGGRG